MSDRPDTLTERATAATGERPPPRSDQLVRWGGIAGLGGAALMLVTFAVVIGLGLPDASDPETLTDFADIEQGRVAEHLLYLGSLLLFGLHVLVLHHILRAAHSAAALFGTALSLLGLSLMAGSSLLHLSTSPLADLYTDPATPTGDLPAIEYAWYGAQSVWDTLLITGLLIMPIGLVFLGEAMRVSASFGPRFGWTAIGLGMAGVIGAVVEVVDRAVELSAVGVLAVVVFHAVAGWRTRELGRHDEPTDTAR